METDSIDLHCHPAMKLLGKSFNEAKTKWGKSTNSNDENSKWHSDILKLIATYRSVVLIFIVLIFFSCKDECNTSYSLYEAYYQAVIFPENFDGYVQNNTINFNEDFYDCLNDKRQNIEDKIIEEQQFCDEAHEQGSDFWHDCYDDIDQTYGGMYNALGAIKEVTNNGKSYESTSFGFTMMLGKNMMGQSDWEYLMGTLIPDTREFLKCTKCEKKFFLF